ncbi:MarR family winged helix-turn-helix transcriptional regulator [Paenibacillus paeoniae]|uniref:MarR family transcriptional regulator n=1 Tax=Paenibacillus paeoniae TaxID=2292705 RepID=A0A371P780_9BACL|nr:MarR family transcriptional regulator [Paenibacillus paeoniae]REK71745.1 MarR family transcriptional regulator [Paenibacillus paeoniae]
MKQDPNLLKALIHRYEVANFVVERGLHVRVKDLMPEELTVDQFKTLRFLRHNENSTASELSQYFCVGKSSITAIITRLSDKGLIERVPDDDDRRVTHLMLTEEGERISGLLEERVHRVLSDIIEHFDEKEAIMFIETFEKLAEVVKAL